MKRAEAEKLLGGYATGTLTEAERRALFKGALADQELFNALADEEALRELLADPQVRRRLVAALAEREAGWWERLLGWWQRPWAWGVAGSMAVAALLVVMLLPVYQTTKRPVVQHVAQGPAEIAGKVVPAPPLAPPPAAAVPRRRPVETRTESAVAAPEAPAPQVPEPAVEKQVVAEAEALRTAPAPPPVAERQREQAEVKPKLEAAPAGVVGGVVGGIVAAAPPAASQEADARRLYNAPAAEWKDVRSATFRAKRAADVAAVPTGPVGIRYAILKLGPEGQYAEAAPNTVFAKGDVIRLSVEANQSGVIRLARQDATGAWNTLGEVAVQARVRQAIPAEGLRLDKPEKLALEFVRGGAEPALAGKPRLQKDASGAPQVRAEIDLTVR